MCDEIKSHRIVLCVRSKNSEEERQPATASPHAGSATHGQAGCKEQPATAKALCKGTVCHGQNPLAGTASPQGVAANTAVTVANSTQGVQTLQVLQ
ncbi:hypothetical protein BHE74_00051706, partial [Ensete ventricosum]